MGFGISNLDKQQQTINTSSSEVHHHKNCLKKRCNRNACTSLLLVFSAFNFILGLIALKFSLVDYFLEQRITMSSGFPFQILEKWSKPDLKIKVNVYVFAVENSEEFQSGLDEKLKLKEIGPIVYYQTIQQTDVVFEENSTLSYTTLRNFEFAEDENIPGILNQSLIMVNPLMLSLAAKLENNGYAHLCNFMFNQYDDIFINRTVYEVLWNSSSLLLDQLKSNIIINWFLPTDNFGFLYNAFKVKPERYNVKIGLKNGLENFWKLNLMNGNTKIGLYEEGEFDECPFSVVNATDGTGYHPGLTKESVKLASIRSPGVFNFSFEKEVEKNHLTVNRYVFDKKNLMRIDDLTKDCLGEIGNNYLPDGVIDGSKLAYDMPLAISNPHFYGFNGPWNDYLEGLQPNENHASYIEIEPITGLQVAGAGAMQSNIPVPKINYIDKVKKFSEKIIPVFWIEQRVDDMKVDSSLHFMINVFPIIQAVAAVISFITSLMMIVKVIARFRYNRYISSISGFSEPATTMKCSSSIKSMV